MKNVLLHFFLECWEIKKVQLRAVAEVDNVLKKIEKPKM